MYGVNDLLIGNSLYIVILLKQRPVCIDGESVLVFNYFDVYEYNFRLDIMSNDLCVDYDKAVIFDEKSKTINISQNEEFS